VQARFDAPLRMLIAIGAISSNPARLEARTRAPHTQPRRDRAPARVRDRRYRPTGTGSVDALLVGYFEESGFDLRPRFVQD
jgi:hypothetical protein